MFSLLFAPPACESVLGLDELTELHDTTDGDALTPGDDAAPAAADDGSDGAGDRGLDSADNGFDVAAHGESDSTAESGDDTGDDTVAADGSTADALEGSADGGCVSLKIVNAITTGSVPGCSVAIAGGAFSGATMQIACVPRGPTTLTATPIQGVFGLPTWHDTPGDFGAGDPGIVMGALSSVKVSVFHPSCFWVCCAPIVNTHACPMTDKCFGL
jgi:hypothetical protein